MRFGRLFSSSLSKTSIYGAVSGEPRLHTVLLVCYSRRGAAGGGREASARDDRRPPKEGHSKKSMSHHLGGRFTRGKSDLPLFPSHSGWAREERTHLPASLPGVERAQHHSAARSESLEGLYFSATSFSPSHPRDKLLRRSSFIPDWTTPTQPSISFDLMPDIYIVIERARIDAKAHLIAHDVTMVPKLLTGEGNTVYGDSGYLGAEKRDDAITRNTKEKKIKYRTNRHQSAAITNQEGICSLPSPDQTPRTRKVICQSKSRACIWRGKGAVRLPKNTIPRSGETDCKNEYAVCPGKSDSG